MAGVEILGPDGKQALVTDDQELLVAVSAAPPLGAQKTSPLRRYLTDDGLVTGSNDMGVDGATTPIPFWIPADPEEDTYISSLSIIVGYTASGAPYQWADGAALTNGILLGYDSGRGDNQVVASGIVNNQEMFRLALGQGLINANWEVRHVGAANDYGYFINMDLTKLMPPYGVKLDAGSKQRMFCLIQDDIATVTDAFNILAYGFTRFE